MTGGSFSGAVPRSLGDMRADRAVSLLTGVPRSVAAELVAAGRVRLDGAPVTVRRAALPAGGWLTVEPFEDVPLEPDPSVPFTVVHEDAEIVVVDKPPGVVVHPGAGVRAGTLAAGLLARYPDLRGLGVGDPDRPGIVHRLDRGTSGLLVVARTPGAYRSLVAQLASRTARRKYVALVAGRVAHGRGVVDAPIGRSVRSPTKMAVSATGRPARTEYEVRARLTRLGGLTGPVRTEATLLRCSLESGRTHQIRVHLSSIGHPVVGDERYGNPPRGILAPGRSFLHAAELAFDHPVSGRREQWASPLPADLVAVIGDATAPPGGPDAADAAAPDDDVADDAARGRGAGLRGGVVRADDGAVG